MLQDLERKAAELQRKEQELQRMRFGGRVLFSTSLSVKKDWFDSKNMAY